MWWWLAYWVQILGAGVAFSTARGKFSVDTDGNLLRIRGVTYSWPTAQPTYGKVLRCVGSAGELEWGEGGGGGGTPSDSVTYGTSYGATPSAGTASAYSRGDHTHGTPSMPTYSQVGADAAGTATSVMSSHTGSYNHALLHANSNDPTADQKAALAGTSGTPSSTNKYVTNSDSRNSDARTPTAHGHAQSDITNLVTDLAGKASTYQFSGSAAGLVPTSAGGTTNYLRADGSWAQPPGTGGGTPPAWKGVVAAGWGDGDPNIALNHAMTNGTVAPTPTNIGTSVARCAYFMVDTAINVQKIRWYGVGAVTAYYHIAVYRDSDSARISADHEITTAAATWGSVASSFTLAANTLYLACVSADTTGTTAGMLAMDPTTAATTGQVVMCTSWPGSLQCNAASPKIDPVGTCQFTVTTGAMPATAPARANRSSWTGGMPLLLFDSNGA